MLDLLFYSLVGGLFSLGGGMLLLLKPKLTNRFLIPLVAFGAGAFLSAVFFEILPEAIEMVEEPQPILATVLVGFGSFFVLERFLMKYLRKDSTKHHHSEHTESLPTLLILGDALHNFLDGIVIALAYLVNPTLALPTALAIAAHELPQEIGDFSILLKMEWPRKKIVLVNILQSLLTIPGVFLGVYLGKTLEPLMPTLLAFTAGIFLYIAASDLIPELHHRSSHRHFFRIIVPFLAAIILLYFLIGLSHSH